MLARPCGGVASPRHRIATPNPDTGLDAGRPRRPRILTTTEIVAAARARLSGEVWDYICGGAETETTLLRNRYALDAIAFRPRVLRNVDKADAGTDRVRRAAPFARAARAARRHDRVS